MARNYAPKSKTSGKKFIFNLYLNKVIEMRKKNEIFKSIRMKRLNVVMTIMPGKHKINSNNNKVVSYFIEHTNNCNSSTVS